MKPGLRGDPMAQTGWSECLNMGHSLPQQPLPQCRSLLSCKAPPISAYTLGSFEGVYNES